MLLFVEAGANVRGRGQGIFVNFKNVQQVSSATLLPDMRVCSYPHTGHRVAMSGDPPTGLRIVNA